MSDALPHAWAGQAQWRVLAAGLGPGLDFLATWHAWRGDPQRPRLLHYVALEGTPVHVDDLLRSAASLPALHPLAEELAARWQGLLPGFHRFSFEEGRVLLTLCVGEAAPMLREQAFRADAVLLHADAGVDAKAITRLSRRGTVLSAAQASPQLRQDLRSCGWQVEAGEAGLKARLAPAWAAKGLPEATQPAPGECIVVGAGLAGAAVAASLARRGWSVRVLDAAATPASGASGLPAGLLAPHQSPDDNLLSRLSRAGVRLALQEAQQRLAPGLEWQRTGVLEWRGDDARAVPALGEALAPWSREASAAQKRAAHIAEEAPAWWHENAAWIEPAALVRSWLRAPGVRFTGQCRIARIEPRAQRWHVLDDAGRDVASAPLVVIAAALGSAELAGLALHPVRGQVTWGPHADDAGKLPPFPVNGHGHFLPRVPLVERGAWITGSTYGRGDADARVRHEDIAANVQRVREVLPDAARVMEAADARRELRSWSGVRCASSDRRPLVGELAPGLWASTAMGSRGLTFAALCAELLAARLHGEPWPLEARLAQALDLRRQARARSG